MLVPGNLGPAFRLALEQGHGKLTSVFVSPNSLDLTFVPRHGRSLVVMVTANGKVRTGHQKQEPGHGFAARIFDPGAPARFVVAAAERLHAPIDRLMGVALTHEYDGLRWSAVFDGHDGVVYGAPDGSVVR